VVGDFRFQLFEGSHSIFYMWLNVSAICWNEKLKAKTIQLRRENDPLEFSYISEVDETETIRNSKTKYELVLSDQTNELLARKNIMLPM
jgi:hypothetical protein